MLAPIEVSGVPWSWDLKRYCSAEQYLALQGRVVSGQECRHCGEPATEMVPVWHIDDAEKRRELDGYEPVCRACYGVAWLLRAGDVGHAAMVKAVEQMMFANGQSRMASASLIQDAVGSARRDARKIWTVDISWAVRQGISIRREVFRS